MLGARERVEQRATAATPISNVTNDMSLGSGTRHSRNVPSAPTASRLLTSTCLFDGGGFGRGRRPTHGYRDEGTGVDSVPRSRVHAQRVRTSEVAARAAVNVETLRYYERRGLLNVPGRSPAGYRTWSPRAVREVRFIKRAQQVGFTLSDVEELLQLARGGPESCEDTRAIARERITQLNNRIADLVAMRDALNELLAGCDQPRHERTCPLLRTLESEPMHDAPQDPRP